jgi:hypothetical protein
VLTRCFRQKFSKAIDANAVFLIGFSAYVVYRSRWMGMLLLVVGVVVLIVFAMLTL